MNSALKSETPIRILLVDDNEMVRSSLIDYLTMFDDMEIVGEAGNGKEAVELCSKLHPEVVLMDLDMPVMDGIEATKMITCMDLEIKVIILTEFGLDKTVEAQQAGAQFYLEKGVSMEELVEAIRSPNGKSLHQDIEQKVEGE